MVQMAKEDSVNTVLSVTVTANTIDLLSGTKGLLNAHPAFEGMSNVKFLRLAIAHALNSKIGSDDLIKYLKASETPETFEKFLRGIKKQ